MIQNKFKISGVNANDLEKKVDFKYGQIMRSEKGFVDFVQGYETKTNDDKEVTDAELLDNLIPVKSHRRGLLGWFANIVLGKLFLVVQTFFRPVLNRQSEINKDLSRKQIEADEKKSITEKRINGLETEIIAEKKQIDGLETEITAGKTQINDFGIELVGLNEKIEESRVRIVRNGDQILELTKNVELIKNSMSTYLGDYRAVTRLYTGQKMFVDTRDISLAPHLILDGFWEMWISRIFIDFIREDSVFIDIGANFGYYSLLAASKIRSGKIFAFEPNLELIPIIKDNFSINGLNNSKIESLAVSDKVEDRKLFGYTKLWGNSSLHENWGDEVPDKSWQVRTISLDEYVKREDVARVDVIKIDAEGHEVEICNGMKEVVSRNNVKIFLEFAPRAYKDSKAFFNDLSNDFGFIYGIQEEGLIRLLNYNDLLNNLKNDWLMLFLSKEEIDLG